METVKIVFDVDSKDIKSTTDELKALNKVTNDEVAAMEKLSASATDAGDGFVSLRTRVKEAKEEAVKAAEKYGEFSSQALAAKQKAGQLADQMGDLNRQVNLLNPEAKAKAFSNLAQGVVGAFSIATGALQAFGVKNKEVEALAQKLQAALNITQGIASLKGLKESLDDVKVVLGFSTAAQEGLTKAKVIDNVVTKEGEIINKSFAASLATNPIFLTIAAIGLLAGAMMALGDDTQDAEKEVKKMTDSQKALRDATNEAATAADNLSVAQGNLSKTAADIKKANRDNAATIQDLNEQIRLNNAEIEKNNKVIRQGNKDYEEAILKNAQRRADLREDVKIQNVVGEAYVEAAKKNKELAQTNKDLAATIKAKIEANKANIATIEEEKKAADLDKQKQKQKEAAAEAKQAAKEREAYAKEQLRIADEVRKKLQENALAEISDPIERIKQARQFANENYALEEERLVQNKASQVERDKLAADHTALMKKLDNDEINANKTKNDKVLAAEKKLQDALLALALAQETDPVKRAQIINDAKEKEIDDKLKIVAKGSVEEQALLAEKQTAEIDAQKRVAAAIVEVNKNKDAEITKNEEKAAEDRKALQEGLLKSAQFLGDTLFEASANQTNAEMALLEEQKNKKLISEKDYQQKVKQIRQKQAEDQKKQAIFNATVDLARAIIAALTIPPPGSVVAANFAAALAGANLAKIIATPIPKFQKGTLAVPGVDMGRDSVHAMLQPGEAVIPVQTNRAYHPTIKAIYEKKISPSEINNFVMSRTKAGGSSAITANVDTYALTRALGKNKTVEVGNANVIGRAMARELLRGQNYRRA